MVNGTKIVAAAKADSAGSFTLPPFRCSRCILRARKGTAGDQRWIEPAVEGGSFALALHGAQMVLRVVDRESGKPVVGATLSAFSRASPRAEGATSIPEPERAEPGVFVAQGLEPGTYGLTVRASGYASAWPRVELSVAQGRQVIDLPLARLVPVRGRVVNAAGAPVAGATVTLESDLAADDAVTGADGRFVIKGATPTPTTLRVVRDGFLPQRRPWKLEGEVTFKLLPSQPLTLCVVDGRGRRLKEARAFATLPDERREALEGRDAEGCIRCRLPAGSYRVEVVAPQHPPTTLTVVIDDRPLRREVSLGKGLSLSVRVVDDLGNPLPSAGVRFAQVWQGRFAAGIRGIRGANQPVDREGRLVLQGLEEGSEYVFQADCEGYDQSGPTFHRSRAGGAEPVIAMDRRAKVTGRLLLDGAPVAGEALLAGQPLKLSRGRFEVAVPAGAARLELEGDFAPTVITLETPLDPGGRRELGEVLVKANAEVEVFVRRDARPLAHAQVHLQAAGLLERVEASVRSGARRSDQGPAGNEMELVERTDARGRVLLPKVAPGRYRLWVSGLHGTHPQVAIELAPGEKARQVLDTVPGATLIGIAEPPSECEQLYVACGGVLFGGASSFRHEGLPPGVCLLRVPDYIPLAQRQLELKSGETTTLRWPGRCWPSSAP